MKKEILTYIIAGTAVVSSVVGFAAGDMKARHVAMQEATAYVNDALNGQTLYLAEKSAGWAMKHTERRY